MLMYSFIHSLGLQCQENYNRHSFIFFLGAGNTDHAHVLRDRDPRENCGRANIWSSSGICLSYHSTFTYHLSIHLSYLLSIIFYLFLSILIIVVKNYSLIISLLFISYPNCAQYCTQPYLQIFLIFSCLEKPKDRVSCNQEHNRNSSKFWRQGNNKNYIK